MSAFWMSEIELHSILDWVRFFIALDFLLHSIWDWIRFELASIFEVCNHNPMNEFMGWDAKSVETDWGREEAVLKAIGSFFILHK